MQLKTREKVLIARTARLPIVIFRKCLKLGSKIRVKRAGIDWLLDLDEGIDLSIFLFGCFEPSTTACLKKLVQPGQIALDIGANIGAHTLTLSKLVGKEGRVIAFEPTVFALNKATENIKLNKSFATNITLEQVLLTEGGDVSIPETLYSSWPLIKSDQVHIKHRGVNKATIGATSTSLDDYVDSAKLTRVDFIKMDVDGYECKVLRGATKTLRKHKPTMVMELCPYVLREHGETLDELLRILSSAQYKLFEETRNKPLPMTTRELNALVPDGGSINVIAKVSV